MSLKFSETFKLKMLSSLKSESILVNNTCRIKFIKQDDHLIMSAKDFMSWLMNRKPLLAIIRTKKLFSGLLQFYQDNFFTDKNTEPIWTNYDPILSICVNERLTLKPLRNLRTNLSLCMQLQLKYTVALCIFALEVVTMIQCSEVPVLLKGFSFCFLFFIICFCYLLSAPASWTQPVQR